MSKVLFRHSSKTYSFICHFEDGAEECCQMKSSLAVQLGYIYYIYILYGHIATAVLMHGPGPQGLEL